MTIYFIGAGPGDPELITVKAQKLIQRCPLILFAGSLVPEAILSDAKPYAQKIDSANLNLDQIIDILLQAHKEGKDVARLHSGDPSIYGAIGEQIRRLEVHGVDYEIIPGVTASSASAAFLGKELTLSGVSQTIIMTRYAAKTPMPDKENLVALAQHGATLVIHLGISRIHKIVDDLLPYYGADCPVAVCYRTSWPDQEKIVSTLSEIVSEVRRKKITRTALIIVGQVLGSNTFNDSYLYNEVQSHIYRPKAKSKFLKQE